MAENQILLLPRINYYQWARSVQKFALHFGVGITSDPAKAGDYNIVTVATAPNSYPHEGDIVEWLKQRFPGVNIDLIKVENPENLSRMLDQRIERGIRYHKLLGMQAGEEVLPKYPADRFYLFWPTDYPLIVQAFGSNPELHTQFGLPGHEGVDIRAPHGSNVYACAPGEVYLVEEDPSLSRYGRYVGIRHNRGYRTVYAQLDRVLVRVGDQVRPRQLIGKTGSSSKISSDHLHLMLKKDQATERSETDYLDDIIDPTPFLVYQHQEDEVFEALGVNGSERVSHSFPWRSPCLVGIASRAGGTMQEIDFSVIENARIEAVSIHAKTTSMTLTRLKEMLPEGLILARIAVPFAPHKVSPEKWLEGMRLDIDRLYRLGVRYFEIQRMPNVTQFGWGTTWTSGDQFGQWWLAVAEKLWVEFSGVKLGFPGVSPGGQVPGMRMDSEVFLDGSDNVIRKADWLGVNCFWAHPTELDREEKGSYYEKMRQRYPNKLLFITEFGNLNPHTRPEVKGSEYVRFYERLRKSPGIGAAFAQVVSSAQGYQAMSWRTEDGALTGIVRAVRERPF